MHTVVVYGSLKRGRYNHPLLSDAEFLGTTELVGTMYAVSSYPALLDEGDTKYEAEVYKVNDRVFDAIHNMEIGAGYKEMAVNIKGEDGEVIADAVAYYADDSLAEHCRKHKEVISSY